MSNPSRFLRVDITLTINITKAWELWTTPSDIMQWNFPSADWHCPLAENDLRPGGSFLYRMEMKDGNIGFNHAGKYDRVVLHELIECTGDDGRKSIIRFATNEKELQLIEIFEPAPEPPQDIQLQFVQGVLNNFKRYAETSYTGI